ncbi:fimbrial protein [Morganella psychrotolerans]|uniref:Fimbrial protein n=1 Tax=Morganella psychrotolerans TaxID=368603 RepID=A0A5M9R8S2_9GAMM|nr:fimbrial protein [Morganella psychrotolerans]KAA8716508.1 fimbrial protein [Morganella psychrotolerans]OBU09104.1 hypothetical protein AYY16_07990 [Morganella psychrotolerans]
MKINNTKLNIISVVLGLTLAGAAFAAPQTTSISGGTFKFQGEVVDAACAVATSENNGPVVLNQVRTKNLAVSGDLGNQKKPFSIRLIDCDNSVSENVAVSYSAQTDAAIPAALANIANGNTAKNVALQIFGPDSKPLATGVQSSLLKIEGTEVIIPLSVDYIATGAATSGSVRGEATFMIHFS